MGRILRFALHPESWHSFHPGKLDKVDPEAAAVARERYACLTPWQKETFHIPLVESADRNAQSDVVASSSAGRMRERRGQSNNNRVHRVRAVLTESYQPSYLPDQSKALSDDDHTVQPKD